MSGRGTGRTTRQMLEAPKNAVFIWCNSMLDYPRYLARIHGREDLQITSPYYIEEVVRGRSISGLVIDHACWDNPGLGHKFRDDVERARTRIRPSS